MTRIGNRTLTSSAKRRVFCLTAMPVGVLALWRCLLVVLTLCFCSKSAMLEYTRLNRFYAVRVDGFRLRFGTRNLRRSVGVSDAANDESA